MALALAERGARLVLSSRKAEELDGLVAGLPGKGHRAIVSDLAEEGAALRLLEEAGDLDVLVANAGLPASGRLDGFSQEEIGRALRVNLESPVRMTRELLPEWQSRGSGHFVFVSSISGFVSTPRASLYAATKFGLRGFALNLREDLRRTGIGVSVITPGAIREAGMFADSGAKAPLALAPARRSRWRAPWCVRSSATRAKSPWRRCASARWPASRCSPRSCPAASRAAPRRKPRMRSPKDRRTSAEDSTGRRDMSDTFGARDTLEVSGREYEIFRLDALQDSFDVARLPYSIKVLLENSLRLEDGESVTRESIEAIASWDAAAEPSAEIPFQPARVLMQDSRACRPSSISPGCGMRWTSWAAIPRGSTRSSPSIS